MYIALTVDTPKEDLEYVASQCYRLHSKETLQEAIDEGYLGIVLPVGKLIPKEYCTDMFRLKERFPNLVIGSVSLYRLMQVGEPT